MEMIKTFDEKLVGAIELGVREGIRSALFEDQESLFDTLFDVAKKFLPPQPMEETPLETTDPENQEIQPAP